MAQSESFRLDLGDRQLSGLALGPKQAVPVVCLHGWLDNAHTWLPLARHLSDRRLLALEFAGHGHSDHRAGASWYHMADYLADLHQALDVLVQRGDIDFPFALMGHSLGGAVASLYAGVYPQRIAKLVLVEALGPLPQNSNEAAAQLRRGLASLTAKGRSDARGIDLGAAATARQRAASRLSQASARLLVQRNLRPLEGSEAGTETPGQEAQFIWRSDRKLRRASPVRMDEPSVANILGQITAPCVIIANQPEQPDARRELFAARARLLDDVRIEHLPGGHHLHMENVAPVAECIAEFLDR